MSNPFVFTCDRWLEHVRAKQRAQQLPWQLGSVILELLSSPGLLEASSPVPIVSRTDGDIIEWCGMSPRTYRRHRNALCDAGLMLEIPSGHGSRQKIKVLKYPDWTKQDTIEVALAALDAHEGTEEHPYWDGAHAALLRVFPDLALEDTSQ